MKRDIKSYQRLVTVIELEVDGAAVGGGSDTTDGILKGSEHCKITENGAGDYTVSINEPGERACMAVVSAKDAYGDWYVANAAAGSIDFVENGATADASFYATIFVFASADET